MTNKSRNKTYIQLIRWIFFLAGFALALRTYWPYWKNPDFAAISTLPDLIYHSLDLMTGASPVSGTGGRLVSAARFLCPLSTGAVFISFFSTIANRASILGRSFGRKITILGKEIGKDSVAVYGDNALAEATAAGTYFIPAGNYFLKYAKSHIILMDNDDESLGFYKKHEREMSKDNTYIGLRQMSSFLMRSIPNVSYFNVYEEVARAYWKENSIRSAVTKNPEYSIVILGYRRDNLGYQLLKYGLLNNIVRKDQKITYHIFCKPDEVVRGFEQLEVGTAGHMLGDRILWHTEQWQKQLEEIKAADRILLCRSINPHILNQLLLTCTQQQIHYYDPEVASYPEKYDYQNMVAFGCTPKILNERSILKSELHREAMERHFQYTRQNGTEEEKGEIRAACKNGTAETLRARYWNALTGLSKNSNIATSDFYTINPVSKDLTPRSWNTGRSWSTSAGAASIISMAGNMASRQTGGGRMPPCASTAT